MQPISLIRRPRRYPNTRLVRRIRNYRDNKRAQESVNEYQRYEDNNDHGHVTGVYPDHVNTAHEIHATEDSESEFESEPPRYED